MGISLSIACFNSIVIFILSSFYCKFQEHNLGLLIKGLLSDLLGKVLKKGLVYLG